MLPTTYLNIFLHASVSDLLGASILNTPCLAIQFWLRGRLCRAPQAGLLMTRMALSEWAEVEGTGQGHLGCQEHDPLLQE